VNKPLPAAFLASLGDIPIVTEGDVLRRKSRDNYWYSPVLKRLFDDVIADAILRPRSEAELLQVVRACHAQDIALTPRGGGTANYGQCMPIRGGVVLDMGALDSILWTRPGRFRAQAGARLGAIEERLRAEGQELRMFPSTLDTATVGGFIAGGSGGIGSVTWGMLREPGNFLGARVVTLEAEPRILELRGAELAPVTHAYGTTGILTEVELPAAGAQDWVDVVVTFPDFVDAGRFAQRFAASPGLLKRLCCVLAAPFPQRYLRPLKPHVGPTDSAVLVMVGESSFEVFADMVAAAGGTITYRRTAEEIREGKLLPLYMMAWNHATLWALRVDRDLTYLQTSLPAADPVAAAEALRVEFGDELIMHLEFMRNGPGVGCAGIPLLRFRDEARLREVMAIQEARGCRQFNPHAYTVEDGGMKQVDPVQVDFKRSADPKGLLNPGKLRGWPGSIAAAGAHSTASGEAG
jgi:FAD/FMN-containing dehydrogenase